MVASVPAPRAARRWIAVLLASPQPLPACLYRYTFNPLAGEVKHVWADRPSLRKRGRES